MAASKMLVRAGVAAGVLAAAAGAGFGLLYLAFVSDLPDLRTLDNYQPPLTTSVYDRHGALIGEFFAERRQLAPVEQIPKRVVDAFLAAEDDKFFEHSGVDLVSIARAAWVNLFSDETQGASTITQQLAKNLLLSSERTYTRKVREILLARRIEQRFDKQAILYRYLNHIYFGSGAYGVAEAARTYFDKPLGQLSASEAALIAGLPKAPGKFSPFQDPERAEERRRYVLKRMLEVGSLDQAAYDAALAAPPALHTADREAFDTAAYVTEQVRRRLVDELGNEFVLRGGLRVETTIDLELQRSAVRALRAGVEALDHRRGYRGALRRVPPNAIAGELEKLGQGNAIAAGAPPTEELFAKPRTGVVVAIDDGKGVARVGFGPGFEATLALDGAKWAHPKTGEHGDEIAKLSQAFRVGDVAAFTLSAAPEGEQGLTTALYQAPDVQGSLLSFDVATGDVIALVGGYAFAESEFDRATQAQRQVGSAFKPIVYATALARGFTPATIVYDRPNVYDDGSGALWRPENYGRQFLGRLTLTEALARSINNAAVSVLADVGIEPTLELARKLGIRSRLDTGLSLALGTSSLTLLEITRAYGVFASGGRLVEPRLIARVLDREGKVILEHVPLGGPPKIEEAPQPAGDEAGAGEQLVVKETEAADAEEGAAEEPPPPESEPSLAGEEGTLPVEEIREARSFPELAVPDGYVLAPAHAYVVSQLLRAPVEHPNGTAGAARGLGRMVSGKTGTTNDQTDAWFIGFSPEIVTGVWVGIDARDVLGPKETGGRAALPIWRSFMKDALATRPPGAPEAPDGVTFVRMDVRTGKLAGPGSSPVMLEAFLAGTEPLERAGASESAAEDGDRKLRLDF